MKDANGGMKWLCVGKPSNKKAIAACTRGICSVKPRDVAEDGMLSQAELFCAKATSSREIDVQTKALPTPWGRANNTGLVNSAKEIMV